MKIPVTALFLPLAATLHAAPMYLPVIASTIETPAIGEWMPACNVSMQLTEDRRHIAKATLHIGEEIHDIPAEALSGIESPDLSTIRIETEKGRDGSVWFSIVLQPARHTEHPTRYHISVIDGKFARVSKTWDEPEGTSIRRQSRILYKETRE
ncbi:MAG: hypothetical protein JJU05_19045 [Verrucomicrobia bacterium]|nr:hypothetical protein [Verrucomicrobiota bacterium]MCH8527922.1 hypothetical protein [Kiritimatiellia bacterium]